MRVVVIGAGLLGVSSAYYLNRQGHHVVVLDRQEGAGLETSFANGGMLTPSQADPWNHPGIFQKLLSWIGDEQSPFLVRPRELFAQIGWGWSFLYHSSPARFRRNMEWNCRLANYSLCSLQEIRERHFFAYDSQCNGTLKIYDNEESFKAAAGLSGLYRELGIDYRLLDINGVLEIEPALMGSQRSIIGGLYYPGDESGDAHKFCQCLALEAAKAGVKFDYGVTVAGLDKQKGRITQVNTSQGPMTGDVYLLAAGSFSVPIAKTVGLKLPIRPVKGYSLTLPLNGWRNSPQVPIIDDAKHISITPLGERIRVGGTAELDGFNTSINAQRIEGMFRFIQQIYPGSIPYLERALASEWSGLRPYSCDGVPIMGRTKLANLYLNTGHGHLGWTMAAGSGRVIADMISNRKPEIAVTPYQIDRF